VIPIKVWSMYDPIRAHPDYDRLLLKMNYEPCHTAAVPR
jgi:hypothetical protein